MTQNVDREPVVSRLLAADDILILCHKNPDGDTIGSGTALCLALQQRQLTESAALCPRAAGGGTALLLRGGAARRRLRLVGHRPTILHMVLYICARAVGPAVIRGRHGTAPFR